MAAKELKGALKNAKECIQMKNYSAAIEHCKLVLSLDPNNYHGLVFHGLASENLSEWQNALKSYTKASEVLPEQLLAWQGLMSYYEKTGKVTDHKNLCLVYDKLIDLTKEDDKVLNLKIKLASLYSKSDEVAKSVELYKYLLETLPSTNPHVIFIHRSLIELLSKHTIQENELLKQSYEFLLINHSETFNDVNEMCSNYLDLISKNWASELEEACSKLQKYSSICPVLLERQMYILLEKAIVNDIEISLESADLSKRIEKLSATSPVLAVYKCYQLYISRNFSAAVHIADGMCSSAYACVRLLVVLCHLRVHSSESVLKYADETLGSMNNLNHTLSPKLHIEKLLLCQVEALLHDDDFSSTTRAGHLCKQLKVEHDSLEVDILLCYVCIGLGNFQASAKISARLTGTSAAELAVTGWHQFHTDQIQSARNNLEAACNQDLNSSLYHYHLCCVYWKLLNDNVISKQVCMNTLLMTAKLDPYHFKVFLYLGHYFQKYTNDENKAMRCYQKAYDLHRVSDMAAECLVDSMCKLGLVDEACQILQVVTARASAGGAKWAWLRLGLNQVAREPSVAIQCFQAAIRADPNDAYCWQCLAEGYLNRGSYNAAMKTFTKANQLDPACTYNLYQLANIKQALGLHIEAVADYQSILANAPEYVPALKGLAEVHIRIAKEATAHFYSKNAADNCALALRYLTRAAARENELAMIWKLIGDACTILATVPKDVARLEIPAKLCSKETDTVCSLEEILSIGSRSYMRAIQIKSDDCVSWYDLGVSYFHQASVSSNDAMLTKAVNSLKKSLSIQCSDSRTWSTLGVVLAKMNQNLHAQHCFIKAVEVDSHNAQAWANLGALYLQNDNVTLAHEAFKVAQSLAPDYVNGWIGQAMIAESVAHEETVSLYRHSAELALHEEAALGYAEWIARALEQNESVDEAALNLACDGLTRYVDRRHDNPIAYNIYGLLLERRGLLVSAAENLKKAVQLSEGLEHATEFRRNFARVLSKKGHYAEALEQYRLVKGEHVGLGLAHFKAQRYSESKAEFEKAWTLAQEGDKSQISAVLGMCAFWLHDPDDAKTHFFSCVQSAKPPVTGLMAFCAFGLSINDLTLAAAIVQELDEFITDRAELVSAISALIMTYHRSVAQIDEAETYISKCLEAQPKNADLWLLKTELTLKTEPHGSLVAITNAQNLHQNLPSISNILSRAYCSLDDGEQSYRFAHMAVVSFPDNTLYWLQLLTALFVKLMKTDKYDACRRHLSAMLSLTSHHLKGNEFASVYHILAQLAYDFCVSLTNLEIRFEFADEWKYLVELTVKERDTIDTSQDETTPKEENPEERNTVTDICVLRLRAFIELAVIGLRIVQPNYSDITLATILASYEGSGVFQSDKHWYSRSLDIYNRRRLLKKNAFVCFDSAALACRARMLVYELIRDYLIR